MDAPAWRSSSRCGLDMCVQVAVLLKPPAATGFAPHEAPSAPTRPAQPATTAFLGAFRTPKVQRRSGIPGLTKQDHLDAKARREQSTSRAPALRPRRVVAGSADATRPSTPQAGRRTDPRIAAARARRQARFDAERRAQGLPPLQLTPKQHLDLAIAEALDEEARQRAVQAARGNIRRDRPMRRTGETAPRSGTEHRPAGHASAATPVRPRRTGKGYDGAPFTLADVREADRQAGGGGRSHAGSGHPIATRNADSTVTLLEKPRSAEPAIDPEQARRTLGELSRSRYQQVTAEARAIVGGLSGRISPADVDRLAHVDDAKALVAAEIARAGREAGEELAEALAPTLRRETSPLRLTRQKERLRGARATLRSIGEFAPEQYGRIRREAGAILDDLITAHPHAAPGRCRRT